MKMKLLCSLRILKKKEIRDIIEAVKSIEPEKADNIAFDYEMMIENLTAEMLIAAENLEFERAAELRDRIKHLKKSWVKNE